MRQSTRKNGYTLIEMAAVLVMVLPIITLVSAMLRQSLLQYARTIDQTFEIHAVNQWTQRIREEIHEANEAVVSEDGSSLTLLSTGQESTRYFRQGSKTFRQPSIDGRLLAVEQSPWSFPLHFEQKQSSSLTMIEIDTGSERKILCRLRSHPIATEASQ